MIGPRGSRVRTGFDEAVLTLRGWVEQAVLVRVELRFAACAAAFCGRLVVVTADEIRLLADDGSADFALPLKPTFSFVFQDIRHLPIDHPEFGDMVVVFFDEEQANHRDHVAFAVIATSTD